MRFLIPALLAPAAFMVACAPAALLAQEVVQALPGTTDADRLAEQMRALAANPRDLDALVAAADLSLSLDDLSGAASLFARAEKVSTTDPRIKAGEGKILVRSERPGEALRYFAQAEAAGYDVRGFAADRGLAYDLIGQQERAQRDYRLALKTKPDDEVIKRYALSLGISGRRDEALQQLDPLLRGTDRSVWRIRAFVLAMGGDQAGAEKIATTMLPAGMAQGLLPFFQRLPSLPAVDRAFAVHFGEVHATPERIADARFAPVLPQLAPEARPVALAAVQTSGKPSRNDRRNRNRGQREPLPEAGVALASADTRAPTSVPRAVAPPYQAPAAAPARVQPLPPLPRNAPVTVAAITPVVPKGTFAAVPVRSGATAAIGGSTAIAATPPPATTFTAAPVVANTTPTAAPVTAPPVATLAAATPAAVTPAAVTPAAVTPAAVASATPGGTTAFAPGAPSQNAAPVRVTTTESVSTSVTRFAAATPAPVPTSGAMVASGATPVAPAPAPNFVAPPSRAEADSVLARIVAGLSIPASELGVVEPERSAPAAAVPPTDTAARVLAEAEAKEARDAAAEKALAAKTLADKRAADRKAAADKKALAAKKLADEKKLADAKAAAEEKKAQAEEKRLARANPERIWVQVASGANEGDLPKAFAIAKAKAPGTFGSRAGWSTPLRATNRVLTGPFKTDEEARAFVNQLAKAGVPASTFTSDAGQVVEKLGSGGSTAKSAGSSAKSMVSSGKSGTSRGK